MKSERGLQSYEEMRTHTEISAAVERIIGATKGFLPADVIGLRRHDKALRIRELNDQLQDCAPDNYLARNRLITRINQMVDEYDEIRSEPEPLP